MITEETGNKKCRRGNLERNGRFKGNEPTSSAVILALKELSSHEIEENSDGNRKLSDFSLATSSLIVWINSFRIHGISG